jgi:MFS family permease
MALDTSGEPRADAAANANAPWYREIGTAGWRAISGALIAFTFENFDIFLLSLTIPALVADFHSTNKAAGLVASVTSAGLIVGGILAGWLADRIGRRRLLAYSILVYGIFTGLIAFSDSFLQVGTLRFFAGLGMGGGWTAGAALVAEACPPRHRGKGGAAMQAGLPIGSLLAVGTALLLTSHYGTLNAGVWKILYAVGAVPILFAAYVWFFVPESPMWRRPERTAPTPGLRRATLGLRSAVLGLRRATLGPRSAVLGPQTRRPFLIAFVFVFCVQYVYYAVFTFAPTFLLKVRGMTLTHSLTFTLVQQCGSLVGFVLFGALVDRLGRRPVFGGYILLGGIATALFITQKESGLLLTATFFTGMGIAGIYAGLGPWTAEMMRASSSRAFAMGLIYNGGRIGGALAPFIVGSLATSTGGFAIGMATTLVAFAVSFIAISLSGETKGTELGA